MEANPAPPDNWLRRILQEPLLAYPVGGGIAGGEADCLLEIWERFRVAGVIYCLFFFVGVF